MTSQNTTPDCCDLAHAPRRELVARIVDLEGRLLVAEQNATKSHNVARASKWIGDDPMMQDLAVLGAAILRGRALHPEGPSLAALVSEVGEVATAMLRETPGRVVDECLDVAVVAMRLVLEGERRR